MRKEPSKELGVECLTCRHVSFNEEATYICPVCQSLELRLFKTSVRDRLMVLPTITAQPDYYPSAA